MPPLLAIYVIASAGCAMQLVAQYVGRRIRSDRDFLISDGVLMAVRPRLVVAMVTLGSTLCFGALMAQVWLLPGQVPIGFAITDVAVLGSLGILMAVFGAAAFIRPTGVTIGSDGVLIQGPIRHAMVGWWEIEHDLDALSEAGLRRLPTVRKCRGHRALVMATDLNIDVRTICAAIEYYRVDPSRRSELQPVNGYGEFYRVS